MTQQKIKDDREVEIFSRFVSASRLSIAPSTIEKREPPEPDILCVHNDGGPERVPSLVEN